MVPGFYDGAADAFLLDIHVVGVEMDGDIGLADALEHRQRLPDGIEEMRLVAVARLDADHHAILLSTPGDRLQCLGDIGKLGFGRRRARTPAKRRIGNA